MSDDIRPLDPFEYHLPSSIEEVLELLDEHGKEAQVLAGGTDLIPRMKARRIAPRLLIDIKSVRGLSYVTQRGDALHIGAGTALGVLQSSEVIRSRLRAFAQTLTLMSSPAIRSRATIGGNLCNGSRCADSPASLLALGASVKLVSTRRGERSVALSDFFTDRGVCGGKIVKLDDEIMSEIVVPLEPGDSAFVKLTRRKGSSIGIASVAASVSVADERIQSVRVAIAGIGSTPVRGRLAEEFLLGKPFSIKNVETAAEMTREEIDPISDIRASAKYRTEMIPVLTRRALMKAANFGGRNAS